MANAALIKKTLERIYSTPGMYPERESLREAIHECDKLLMSPEMPAPATQLTYGAAWEKINKVFMNNRAEASENLRSALAQLLHENSVRPEYTVDGLIIQLALKLDFKPEQNDCRAFFHLTNLAHDRIGVAVAFNSEAERLERLVNGHGTDRLVPRPEQDMSFERTIIRLKEEMERQRSGDRAWCHRVTGNDGEIVIVLAIDYAADVLETLFLRQFHPAVAPERLVPRSLRPGEAVPVADIHTIRPTESPLAGHPAEPVMTDKGGATAEFAKWVIRFLSEKLGLPPDSSVAWGAAILRNQFEHSSSDQWEAAWERLKARISWSTDLPADRKIGMFAQELSRTWKYGG